MEKNAVLNVFGKCNFGNHRHVTVNTSRIDVSVVGVFVWVETMALNQRSQFGDI